jgi:hypothetical protein
MVTFWLISTSDIFCCGSLCSFMPLALKFILRPFFFSKPIEGFGTSQDPIVVLIYLGFGMHLFQV